MTVIRIWKSGCSVPLMESSWAVEFSGLLQGQCLGLVKQQQHWRSSQLTTVNAHSETSPGRWRKSHLKSGKHFGRLTSVSLRRWIYMDARLNFVSLFSHFFPQIQMRCLFIRTFILFFFSLNLKMFCSLYCVPLRFQIHVTVPCKDVLHSWKQWLIYWWAPCPSTALTAILWPTLKLYLLIPYFSPTVLRAPCPFWLCTLPQTLFILLSPAALLQFIKCQEDPGLT